MKSLKFRLLCLFAVLLFGCKAKPHIVYRMPASYLIDDSTGRRVTDSGGRMIIDTTHPWGHKPQIKTW